MAFRTGLISEVLRMALDTLRNNMLRSALTILGVVIGVTSIVGMTSLVRGFGDQLQELIRQMGADSVYVSKMSISSFASGKSFMDILKRPNITEADAKAIKDMVPSAGIVSAQLGGGPGAELQRLNYGATATKRMAVIGAQATWAEINYIKLESGRFVNDFEVQRRRDVIVLGNAPATVLFPSADPVGKKIRLAGKEFTVIGVLGKRPSAMGGNPDEFAVIPISTYDKMFQAPRMAGFLMRFVMIGVTPREGATRDQLVKDIEELMRVRHRLRLDQENDFDMLTSDSVMGIVNQLTQAVFLALIVISSIALMVGGIGVMAIMTISVTERTREIGVRKALGARRREILMQFLVEAVFLTSVGGVLGILLGSLIGLSVNYFAGFPVSLPLWSFGLGIGFSATVGIFFGMWPAVKAAKLDPIEALRYE
ncbi:MAG: ABC transporter permease [Acidobacteria bacterium]|jgi:putative ABC transport system permease protein|nr:ABC transporter permease [Acidobacteriota bacterium]